MMADLPDRLNAMAERGTAIGSKELRQRVALRLAGNPFVPERRFGGARRRSRWGRNAVAFAGGTLALVVAIGAVILLQGPFSTGDGAATTTAPTATTTPPTATTTPPTATTTSASTTDTAAVTTTSIVEPPPSVVLPISWQRIDGPGAFDLNDSHPEWGGQGITTIIPVPSCADCGDVAMYVAAGHVGMSSAQWDARVWISEDGNNWEAIEAPGFSAEGGQRITSLATNGSRIVAAGASSTTLVTEQALVWVSDDLGRTWVPVSDTSLEQMGSAGIYDVAWTGDGFIAAGGEFWYSPDGLNWEITTDLGDAEEETVNGIARFGDGWVAVGETPTIASGHPPAGNCMVWASGDGRTWSLVHSGSAAEDDCGGLHDVLAVPDGLVATGAIRNIAVDPQVWRSEDGTDWEQVLWDPGSSVMDRDMADLARIGDWTVAIGVGAYWGPRESAGLMWASPDNGLTWASVRLTSEVFDGGIFVHAETMTFPAEADGDRLVLTGSYRGNAAIWVGTLEE